jgi:hypothetical protein
MAQNVSETYIEAIQNEDFLNENNNRFIMSVLESQPKFPIS